MSTQPPRWTELTNAYDRLKWYENRGMLILYFFISIIFVGQILNGYDGTILSGLQVLDKWNEDLGYPNSSGIGILNAISYMTGICAGPVASVIADKWGRRWCLRLYGITMCVGTVLGCLAGLETVNGFALFVASKGIIGFGLASFMMTGQIVLQEITHPRNRPVIAALFAVNWTIGVVMASWTRVPYMIQLLPAAYILIAVQFLPETPRFLIAQGQEDDAKDFLIKYHANGDAKDELIQFEFEEMKASIELEKAARAEKWSNILAMKGNKHRLFLAGLMTFLPQMNSSAIFDFYYTVVLKLVGITKDSTITGIASGLSMSSLVAQVAGVLTLKRCRRRPMVLYTWPYIIVCLVGMTTCGAMSEKSNETNRHAGIASVAMVWLVKIPSGFTTPLFYSYPAEILTYSIRGKGMAVWNTVNQALGCYSAYVNSVALDAMGWKYYCVYIPILCVQWVLAYLFMVETYGYTLEEITTVFEEETRSVNLKRLDETMLKCRVSKGWETSQKDKDADIQITNV